MGTERIGERRMLPDKPEVKLLSNCIHGELIRIPLEEGILFAIYYNIKGFSAIVSLGTNGATKYIDPCHKKSQEITNSFKMITVLSYETDWRIELINALPPEYCSTIDEINSGDLVIAPINGQGEKTVGRSYLCASNDKGASLLMHLENDEIMDGIIWPFYAFSAWDLFVGRGSPEAIFSHRPAIAQGNMAGAI